MMTLDEIDLKINRLMTKVDDRINRPVLFQLRILHGAVHNVFRQVWRQTKSQARKDVLMKTADQTRDRVRDQVYYQARCQTRDIDKTKAKK